MDGSQVSDLYWLNPLEAAKLFISKLKCARKLNTKFERLMSENRPGLWEFGRANSGLVF